MKNLILLAVFVNFWNELFISRTQNSVNFRIGFLIIPLNILKYILYRK